MKASYLYKFAPFVTWPARAAGGAAAPFTICIVGHDPFGPVLDRAVAGQRLADRPISVVRLGTAPPDASCQIAFVGGSRAQDVKDALRTLHGEPVLTVTDGGGTSGIIDFTVVDGRVRFRVDDEAAAENGLTISSKLLSLALSVRSRQGGGGE